MSRNVSFRLHNFEHLPGFVLDRPIINITLSGVLPQQIQQRTELTPIKYSHVVYDNISQRIQDEAHCAGPETD